MFPFERSQTPAGTSIGGKQLYEINCVMCDARTVVLPCLLFRKFCSKECRYGSLAVEYRGHTAKFNSLIRKCETCATEFFARPCEITNGGGKFCSRKCFRDKKLLREDRSCPRCGNTFNVPRSAEKICCSKQCALKKQYEEGRVPTRAMRGRTPTYNLYSPYEDRLGRSFVFRSSYEIAFVEQYLDKEELTWQYEPRCFELERTTYTPDFWVEELKSFVEIKGWLPEANRVKLVEFERTYPTVPLVLADQTTLKSRFNVDVSSKVVKNIHLRFKIGARRTRVPSSDEQAKLGRA